VRIGQGRRDDKTHLLHAAHLVARELYGALRYCLEAAHAAAEAALVEARRRVRLNEERESS
jgi:uncharacterized protein (DUF1778 family)